MMFLRCLLAAIFCFTTAAKVLPANIADLDPAEHYQAAGIVISGNHKFSEGALLAVMQTKTRPSYAVWKPRPAFNSATFRQDLDRIKRFYQAHGYYGAIISYDLGVSGKLITAKIHITEGAPIIVKAIRITIKGDAPAPSLIEPLFKPLLKVGDIFSESAYQLEQAQLLDVYMHHGYAHAEAERRAEIVLAQRRAFIWYVVTTGDYGVFGATVVRGTDKVAHKLILRELTYQPGEIFDSRKIAASRAKIVGLNLFSLVEFLPQMNPADPRVVPIEIKVHEKPKHAINLALGYNTESLFNVGVSWDDYNFDGGGRQLSLLAQYSNVISTLDAKLVQPFFFRLNQLSLPRPTHGRKSIKLTPSMPSRWSPAKVFNSIRN
jgi:outer membrane protein assembly factor BamA